MQFIKTNSEYLNLEHVTSVSPTKDQWKKDTLVTVKTSDGRDIELTDAKEIALVFDSMEYCARQTERMFARIANAH